MEKLGLYSQSEVDQMAAGSEYIEYSEGCLLDNFIFWDSQTQRYFLCVEYALNEWSSCYQVFTEGKNGTEIFDMWYKLMENMDCIA